MKLTKLSSAVSVSLLAVALTACGGSNEANDPPVKVTTPEVNANTNTDAAKKAEEAKKAQEAAQKAQAAKVAALVAALKEAGLNDANATFVANSNPDLAIGSTDYNALLAAKLAEQKKVDESGNQGAAPTKTTSEVVVKSNPFIKGIDTSKNETVTANQYSRQPGSNFDRRANPSELGGLGEVGIDDPTVQNPYLSNYVLAVEAVNGKVVAIDSTGELAVAVAPQSDTDFTGRRLKTGDENSPYLNLNNIKNKGTAYTASTLNDGEKQFSYYAAAAAAGANNGLNMTRVNTDLQHGANASDIDLTTHGISTADINGKVATLQEVNKVTTAPITSELAIQVLDKALRSETSGSNVRTAAAAAAAAAAAINDLDKSGLIVYNKASTLVADKDGQALGMRTPSVGFEENVYDAKDEKILNPVKSQKDANTNLLAKERITLSKVGNDKVLYVQEVFDKGSAYTLLGSGNVEAGKVIDGAVSAPESAEVRAAATPTANVFETRIFGKNYRDYEAGAKGNQKTDNTYVARYNANNGLTSLSASKLQHVQYGRLTNNIDVLANKTDKDEKMIIYRQFQQHGAANSVDTYFYRGTNKTTLEQMADLKAKGGVIEYHGHALTYGIGPKVAAKTAANTVPTAYGLGASESTIGNFVNAKFDVAKSRVDGTIYNFVNDNVDVKKKKSDFVKQDLVSFGGDVYGNTVTGTATKLGLGEQGTFTGSFFGKDASELGGSISSIERSKGYAQPKWGAVFGATKGSNVDNFNVIEQQNKTATP